MHDSDQSPERKQLISWLSDAHAMELSVVQMLENLRDDAEDHGEVHRRTQRHVDESKRHAELVARCIELLGGDKPSGLKNVMGKAMGKMQGAMSAPFGDELMKNCIGDYGSEHVEIACYRSIILAADELGEQEVSRLCGEILRDEEEMARWLEEQLPRITREALHQAPAAR